VTISAVETSADGRPLLLVRPDWTSPGRCSIEILSAVRRAQALGGAICFLAQRGDEPIRVIPADVPIVKTAAMNDFRLEAVWRIASGTQRVRGRWREASASVSHELYREFRRHAGDERLPSALRQALRARADRAHANALAMRVSPAAFPRRLLREPTKISMAPAIIEQGRARLLTYGVSDGTPLVVFDVRTRPDIATALIRSLAREGYIVVITGNHVPDIGAQTGVVDLTTAPRSLAIEMFALSVAAFALCGSIETQHLAYLTDTPSLTINARDPFSAYPLRANCRFTLRTAIDLDTGRVLGIDELLTDRYFRNLRNCGYRDNTADELIDAVAEIRAGLGGGWTETQSQARFRSRVAEASLTLEPAFPFVAEWGADEGFIGDGALVRFQADRAS